MISKRYLHREVLPNGAKGFLSHEEVTPSVREFRAGGHAQQRTEYAYCSCEASPVAREMLATHASRAREAAPVAREMLPVRAFYA